MQTTTTTYYDHEFKKLGVFLGSNKSADMKLISEQGETRWLTVTPEQISAILEILNQSEG
jgi:hypothetical protein